MDTTEFSFVEYMIDALYLALRKKYTFTIKFIDLWMKIVSGFLILYKKVISFITWK